MICLHETYPGATRIKVWQEAIFVVIYGFRYQKKKGKLKIM